jgi:hypothetical protein
MLPATAAWHSSSSLNAGDALTNIASQLADKVAVDINALPHRPATENTRHCFGYAIDAVSLAAHLACIRVINTRIEDRAPQN